MDKQTIQLNYESVIREADRLEAIGRELDQMQREAYLEALSELGNAWDGSVSDAFLRKAHELQYRMRTTSVDLITIGAETRRKAKRIRDAELAALDVAQNRTYGGTGGAFSGGGGGGFGGGSAGGR